MILTAQEVIPLVLFYIQSVYSQIVIVNADGDTEAAVLVARDVYTLLEPIFTGAGMYSW
jgi:hypothetical protein